MRRPPDCGALKRFVGHDRQRARIHVLYGGNIESAFSAPRARGLIAQRGRGRHGLRIRLACDQRDASPWQRDRAERAQVLREVAEDSDLRAAEFRRAFVLMQYFGYLRRDPNDSPDHDFSGYQFWLDKLNSFGGNFVDAEMVKSFLVSGEYRQRFGP